MIYHKTQKNANVISSINMDDEYIIYLQEKFYNQTYN